MHGSSISTQEFGRLARQNEREGGPLGPEVDTRVVHLLEDFLPQFARQKLAKTATALSALPSWISSPPQARNGHARPALFVREAARRQGRTFE